MVYNTSLERRPYQNEFKGNLSEFDLDRNQELSLIRKAQNGDKEARDTLITKNLRLVVKIAKGYIGLADFEDLVYEGSLGLFDTVDKFDETEGTRFGTYAGRWIHQKIRRFLQTDIRTIRLPVYLETIKVRLNRIIDENEDISIEEIAKELKRRYPKTEKIQLKKVSQYLQTFEITNVTSLDQPIGEDEDGTLEDMVGKEDIKHFSAYKNEIREILEEEMEKKLDTREKTVLELRFLENHTLQEIGDILNISRERVRQLQEKALKKMEGSILLKNAYKSY